MGKIIDITGQRFGKLTALRYDHKDKENKAIWECRCDCGNIVYVSGKALRTGNTKSCGCGKVERARLMKYKDGRCSDRLHHVWDTMLKRCYNSNCNVYKHYGGRGIVVCEAWHDYSVFKNWAYANGYDDKAPRGKCTIDRIDVYGNYCPENCRWVGVDVQIKNRRPFPTMSRDSKTGRFVSKKESVV